MCHENLHVDEVGLLAGMLMIFGNGFVLGAPTPADPKVIEIPAMTLLAKCPMLSGLPEKPIEKPQIEGVTKLVEERAVPFKAPGAN